MMATWLVSLHFQKNREKRSLLDGRNYFFPRVSRTGVIVVRQHVSIDSGGAYLGPFIIITALRAA
jgi:hypothetical protein